MTNPVNSIFHQYKYTGKELDLTHGLNTYDHGARQNYSILGVWDRVDPMAEKYYNTSPYVVCDNNPIKLLDSNGCWPWDRKSLICYSGKGIFKLRMQNFSQTTRSNFHRANNNPANWSQWEIGINTDLISIKLQFYTTYSVNHKAPGIREQSTIIEVANPIAKSTGMPDKRYASRVISPGNNCAASRVILAVDACLMAIDSYLTFTSYFDGVAFENQTKALGNSIDAVNDNMDLVPKSYQKDSNIMGAIVNYVFQGENTTRNKNITNIGTNILKRLGRYDKEKKKYIPLINN